ncbi:MAG: DNA repair protein RadC [Deltaproteobacteria bacterium]|nr:DNA repair protein RadC [Deltaproteobacteria bacterium]MBW1962634.1 DNA repair protein RadC [Deltaproteobacteria bacterium]MBW1992857.1 DNA repair protein RadC [Deltaproteobacteria bacterium]MBW2153235.1 DNA repair protein RadC [Deltaproteobacteria bacterium]
MVKSKGNKNEGHRQRLRDKFTAYGLSGFHDYEVIELLLTLATPRKDCKAAAKAALKRFKTLQAVLEASSGDLCRINGIGPKNVFGIKLIKAVAERYLEKKLIHKDPINNSKELFDYLYLRIGERSRECFLVLFLDAKNRVIASEILFEGTLTTSSVYPREVIRAAIEHRAAALIFAHNHPSGDPAPSKEDMAVTRQLAHACKVMDITVHEHLVIGENRYFSFADSGHLKQMIRDFIGNGLGYG